MTVTNPATTKPPKPAVALPLALLLTPFVVFELELVTFGFPLVLAFETVTPVAFLQTDELGLVAVEENVISAQLYRPPSESPLVTT